MNLSEPLVSDGSAPDLQDIIDLDSHEMIPIQMWPEQFGEEAARLIEPIARGLLGNLGESSTARDDIVADDAAIDYNNVWIKKGPDTPSAIDMSRRPSVMDVMGIRRQFIFPTFGLVGMNLFHNPSALSFFNFELGEVDQKKAGQAAIDAYNEWATRVVRDVDGNRHGPARHLDPDCSSGGQVTGAPRSRSFLGARREA